MSMSIFHDFLPMWAAGRAIQLGIDPYDPTVIASILYDTLQAEGQTLNAWPGGFMYPPWSLWIFFLFSLLPLGIAKYLWSLIGCTSIALVVRCEFLEKEPISRIPIVILATALIAFLPLTKHILFGQSSWIVLLTTYCSWRSLQNRNYRNAGILLGIAQVKSHILLGFSTFMIAYSLRKGKQSLLLYFVATLAVESGLALALDGNAFSDFFKMISARGNTKPHVPTAAPIDFVSYLFQVDISRRYAMELAFFGIIASLIIGIMGQGSERNRNTTLIISLLTTPFCWVNDYLILLPAYLGCIGSLFTYSRPLTVIVTAVLALSGIWISGDWIHREVWGWVYLPLFVVWIWKSPQNENETDLQLDSPQPVDIKKHPLLHKFKKVAKNIHFFVPY